MINNEAFMKSERIYMNWQVGWSESKEQTPVKFIPALVPGAVQLDLAKAEGYEDYHFSDNYKQFRWTEDVYWHYRTTLETTNLFTEGKLFFVSKGIDYRFDIFLDSQLIFEQEGMFTPVELDLSDICKAESLLEIVVYPAPKRIGAPEGRWEADQSCKPAVSYGWDWHPRLIPAGIWDDTYLVVRPKVHMENVEVSYSLNDSLEQADLKVEITLSGTLETKSGYTLQFELKAPDGTTVCSVQSPNPGEAVTENMNTLLSAVVENPLLWWPNGYGDPNLYTWNVSLKDPKGLELDRQRGRLGFRKTRLLMHEGAWDEPVDFPKGRSNPPITLEINNIKVFCRGSNWVNPEIFFGTITAELYEELIILGKEANMNIFRIWGGSIVNKDSFFDLCDEHGMMVWQEFPLACNNYIGTPHYLKILEQEAVSIIKRLRIHPSLVLWCGGNELFNGWSGMTDQSHALRLLNALCYQYDQQTPFLMTSPVMGMAHGYYLFDYNDGRDVFQAMISSSATAYTEFGCPGPSSVEILEKIIPADELFPPIATTAWTAHHAFQSWPGGGDDTWICTSTIKKYFGSSQSLKKLVAYGQLLQGIGYQAIFEEARKQKPRCSMAINWCFNEPWPTAANNSIIAYGNVKKKAYEFVKNACRPVLLSARIPRFSWKEGELLSFELWLLNDSLEETGTFKASCILESEEGETSLLEWNCKGVPALKNELGPTVNFRLGNFKEKQLLKIRLVSENLPHINSEYQILYIPLKTEENIPRGLNV
jgi:beta-mannosidase